MRKKKEENNKNMITSFYAYGQLIHLDKLPLVFVDYLKKVMSVVNILLI